MLTNHIKLWKFLLLVHCVISTLLVYIIKNNLYVVWRMCIYCCASDTFTSCCVAFRSRCDVILSGLRTVHTLKYHWPTFGIPVQVRAVSGDVTRMPTDTHTHESSEPGDSRTVPSYPGDHDALNGDVSPFTLRWYQH